MRGGSYRRIDKNTCIFDHNRDMLHKMFSLIDISKAEATVAKDKEDILNIITDNGKDADGIKKLNGKVRGTIISSIGSKGIVQNAACGDKMSLALVAADPLKFLFGICEGGFTGLLRDYILKDEHMRSAIKSMTTSDGWTALMHACQGGHVDTARLLIDSGADVNAKRTSDGLTALMAACQGGHVDTARLLIDSGADVNAKKTSDGWTALMDACFGGHVDTARLLIDSGADLNAKRTSDGQTALMLACIGGHVDTARLLIDSGADVNAKRTSDGWTALMALRK